MLTELTSVECRILGSLAEKSITVREQYPLSFNSLMLACNQKSSRDPVMSLDSAVLGRGIDSLVEKGLVQKHLYSGERSVKFTHCLSTLLDTLDPKVTAVFIVLMLRGPQTAAELKTRTERLYQFGSTAEVEFLLQQLCAAENPMAAKAPRRPGQKDGRYMHLFCGMPSCTENEQNEKRPLVFNDKTEERLRILENKISVLEKWLKDFSEGAFSPFEPPEQAVSSEMVSSESAGSSMPAGKTVAADAAASAASEVSVSGESSSVINGTSAAVTEDDGGHDAPPGTVS